jgi:hypothetical protein
MRLGKGIATAFRERFYEKQELLGMVGTAVGSEETTERFVYR